MSRRQHTWVRIVAAAVIVGLQLLPRGPHGASSTVAVGVVVPEAALPTARAPARKLTPMAASAPAGPKAEIASVEP